MGVIEYGFFIFLSPWHHFAVSSLLGGVADFPRSNNTNTQPRPQPSWKPGDGVPVLAQYGGCFDDGTLPTKYVEDCNKFNETCKIKKYPIDDITPKLSDNNLKSKL